MLLYLIITFLLLPFIDLYILVELSGRIGFLNTLAIVLATGVIGAEIIRREGRQVFRKLQKSVTAEEVSRNLTEAVLLVLGGLLLLSPGLITDFIGFLCVLRSTRQRLMLRIVDRAKDKMDVEVQSFRF